MELLLLSSSRSDNSEYLAFALDAIRTIASNRVQTLFIPFAGVTLSWDEYTAKVQAALASTGLELIGAHRLRNIQTEPFELIMVGGGNTFQLLHECRQRGLIEEIRKQVITGAPYIGWSAGANLACPTIGTTNDMPITDPGALGTALSLINFQINPHYTNVLPPGHHGETRDQCIAEYTTLNPDTPVLGLPEGDWVYVTASGAHLEGPYSARMFQGQCEAITLTPPTVIGKLSP